MKPGDPNVLLLETVARQLGDGLREALVFVGGAVVGLLITDPAAPPGGRQASSAATALTGAPTAAALTARMGSTSTWPSG